MELTITFKDLDYGKTTIKNATSARWIDNYSVLEILDDKGSITFFKEDILMVEKTGEQQKYAMYIQYKDMQRTPMTIVNVVSHSIKKDRLVVATLNEKTGFNYAEFNLKDIFYANKIEEFNAL